MRVLREEAIIQIIQKRLSEDQRTCGQTIDVICTNGDVSLLGCCDSEEQKRTALIIAQGTCGVRAVIDKLRVRCKIQSV